MEGQEFKRKTKLSPFKWDDKIPTSIEDFLKTDGGEFVQSLFRGFKFDSTIPPFQPKPSPASLITIKPELLHQEVGSFLVVAWDRENFLDGKWSGGLRFLWTLSWPKSDGDNGMIMFTTFDSDKNRFDVSSVCFFLGKDKDGNWKANNRVDVPRSQGVVADLKNFEKVFPMMGDLLKPTLEAEEEVKGTWGLMKGKEELSDLYDGSGEKDPILVEEFQGVWFWVDGDRSNAGDYSMDKWCSDLQSFSDTVYIQSTLRFEDIVDKFFGNWNRFK